MSEDAYFFGILRSLFPCIVVGTTVPMNGQWVYMELVDILSNSDIGHSEYSWPWG